MQINLKQAEIVEALKEYVGGQGINLKNKSFTVTFTAGRKEAGLLADISIETIEGSTAQDEPAEKKTLEAAQPAVAAIATAPVGAGVIAVAGGAEDEEDAASAVAQGFSDRPLGQIPAPEAGPTTKVSSLFS